MFANEPLVEIEAPISEAQLVEAFVMNQIHLQTVLASKAARVVDAARGPQVVDFALRQMHGIDAGLKRPARFIGPAFLRRRTLRPGRRTELLARCARSVKRVVPCRTRTCDLLVRSAVTVSEQGRFHWVSLTVPRGALHANIPRTYDPNAFRTAAISR